MSTRSVIAIENSDGTLTGVYCHHDGYTEHHAPILKNNYDTEEKIRELLSFGDMSILEKSIKTCVFYNRDRGEDAADVKADTYDTFKNLNTARWDCEYFYIFRNNSWECYDADGLTISLKKY